MEMEHEEVSTKLSSRCKILVVKDEQVIKALK